MATVEVAFKGIHRDTNEGLSPDGECMQLIGATVTDEGVRMLDVPTQIGSVTGTYHQMRWFAKGNCYLALDSANHLFSIPAQGNNSSDQGNESETQGNNLEPVSPTTIVGNVAITGYETVGNMICCFTADGIYYVLHKGTDFIVLGNKPAPPRLHASNLSMKVEDIIERGVTTAEEKSRQHVSNLCLVAQATLAANSYFIDRAFFRVGFRMFDGTYVSVSPIYCCEPTESQNESVKRTDDSHVLHKLWYIPGLDKKYDLFSINRGEGAEIITNPTLCSSLLKDAFNYSMGIGTNGNATSDVWCGICGFKPALAIDIDDLSNWKGIISSVDVFTTGSVIHHKMITERDTNGNTSQRMAYTPKEEYAKDVEKALQLFRKVASFDLDGNLMWQLKDLSPEKLQVQDALSDYNTNSLIVSGEGEQTYVYNNRLHVGNVSEALPPSYQLSDYFNHIHIPRQKDPYEFIKYGGENAYIAFRLHAYDYADFKDVENSQESSTYLFRYKAWLSFSLGQNFTSFDRRIVYTRHRVDRNGTEETYRNGGWGAGMDSAFVLDSVHASGVMSREVNGGGYVVVTDENRSSYTAEDGIRNTRMFSTVEILGEMDVETGTSEVYGTHNYVPLIYSTHLLSYPSQQASKLGIYKKYTSGNSLVVNGTTYYLVSEYPEIFLDSYYYRWKSASGNELFTEQITSTTIYTFPDVDDKCKVFGVALYNDNETGKTTPTGVVVEASSQDYTIKREYELKDLGLGSISVNYDENHSGCHSLGENGLPIYGIVDVEALDSGSVVRRGNVLKVSGLDNPLVFPSAQTYQLDGAIVGMQANTEELGEGQHGENPLYVFTDQGTFAMYVDKTGKTVYPAVDAVSGDVLNGDTVSLADGVVMATSRGLMMLRGKQRTWLSKALDGEDSWLLPTASDSAMTGGDDIIRKVTDVSLIEAAAKTRSTELFRDYLQGGRLGYDYVHGLLYVSNAEYGYTYVYNLASGEWSKMAVKVSSWVSAYPKCVYATEATENNATEETESDATEETENTVTKLWTTDNMEKADSKLLLITRPIKVARGLKRMDQFALEGFIRQSTEVPTDLNLWEDYNLNPEITFEFEGETMTGAQKVGVYVLGSLDGMAYRLVGGRATGKPTTRIVGRFLRTAAYRYFIVCVVGGLKTNSIVNDVVLDVTEAFNRRLR